MTLRRGAARAPVRLLDDWARFHGVGVTEAGWWTVPGMEPEPYELCNPRGYVGGLSRRGVLDLSLVVEEAPADLP